MGEARNVGVLDSRVRIVCGLACVGLVGYHIFVARVLPTYALIGVVVLIPFFLKTGATRVCPIMKALGVSSNRERNEADGGAT